MTTVWFGTTWLPVIGTTETFVNATLFGGCAPACMAASGTITAASRAHPTTDMDLLLSDIVVRLSLQASAFRGGNAFPRLST